TILHNEADTGGNHWLGIELRGKNNADVVGARLVLETEDGIQTRVGTGGGSYLSSGDRRHVFGLGKAMQAGKLTVTWPSGEKQAFEGLAMDRYWRITEGEQAPRDLSKKYRDLTQRRQGAKNRRVLHSSVLCALASLHQNLYFFASLNVT